MSKEQEVIEVLWEHRMVTDGQDHYLEKIRNKEISETKLGEQLLQQMAPTVVEKLNVRIESASKALLDGKPGRREHWSHLLPLIEAEVASFAILQSLMYELSKAEAPTYHHVCYSLAESYVREIRFQKWRKHDKKYTSQFLQRNSQALASKAQHKRFALKMEKRISDYLDGTDYDLSRRALFSLGALLLDCIKEAQPEMIEERATTAPKGKFKAGTIYWTDDFLNDVSRLHAVASLAQPIKRPMIVPPKEWKRDADGKIKGGYYLLEQKVYRTDWYPHRFNPSDEALEALNVIQGTPWRVNERVLAFLRSTEEVTPEYPESKPKKLSKEHWSLLDEETQRKVQQQFTDDLSAFTAQTSKAMTFQRQVLQAEELRGKIFWQPHAFDFRGRLYPSNQMLTSIGDHIAKGLIEFANGKKLGVDGLRSLKLHVANTFGWDKLSLDERATKVDETLSDLLQIPDNNKLAISYLKEADEPMAFYASVLELADAYATEDVAEYISHIPIAVDGTCNGLQILSLLGKDSVGAEKTNCTSVPTRKDLYMEVASAVRSIMCDLKNDPNTKDETLCVIDSWWSKMETDTTARKVCKRAMMTTPYGVTKEGIREQLVKDRFTDDLVIPECYAELPVKQARNKLAGYMRDWIIEGRVSAVAESVKIMEYLRDTAKALAKEGYPLSWVTPDGCEVAQNYVVLKDKAVRTFDNWMRRLRTRTDVLSPSKNAGAAAPNVVHSLDASMLRQVARELSKQGIMDMAFVHDSYAVHACHLNDLNRILRQVAVEMFEGNWIEDSMKKGIDSMVKGEVSLPQPPKQGNLDVREELPNALYFFS